MKLNRLLPIGSDSQEINIAVQEVNHLQQLSDTEPEHFHAIVHSRVISWLRNNILGGEALDALPPEIAQATECVARYVFYQSTGHNASEADEGKIQFYRTLIGMGFALAQALRLGELSFHRRNTKKGQP